jgi:hypothetical protein
VVSGFPRPFTGDHITAKLAVLSVKSGRADLNRRPLEPHSSALAWLRYAPKTCTWFPPGPSQARTLLRSVGYSSAHKSIA